MADPPAGCHRVAVYGGTFDPVTRAHMLLVREILELGAADVVAIVPCGNREDKPATTDIVHRIEMLASAVEQEFGPTERVVVDRRDAAAGAFTPTVELAAAYRRECPAGSSVFLVIGEDLVESLPRWKQAERLLRENAFLVCPRPGYALARGEEGQGALADAALVRLADFARACGRTVRTSPGSSTAARRELGSGRPEGAPGLLPASVLSYIDKYGLYQRPAEH